jgi:hypothetical protein
METDIKSTASPAPPVRRSRRLWLWFVGGFLLVFVALLLLVHMVAMHPSGQFAVRYPLWQYYMDGLPRLFGNTMLGPGNLDRSLFWRRLCFTCCSQLPVAARRPLSRGALAGSEAGEPAN